MSDSLTTWVQANLGPLFEQTQELEQRDIDGLLKSTFLSDAKIVFNHENVTLDQFKENLDKQAGLVAHAKLEWKDIIDIPATEGEGQATTGISAGSFVVTQSLKFKVRAAPAQKLTHMVFSAKVIVVAEADAQRIPGANRISELYITSVTKAVPIHLPIVGHS